MSSDIRDRLEAAISGSYTLEREIPGAGMSRVFLAKEKALDRRVVVKVLPLEMAGAVNGDRFRREVQLAAQLQHAHIVPLLSAGDADGLLYYTMPYVEGETLRQRITRTGEMSIPETVGILRDVLKALAYAHKRGVVHRDIKPENILLTEHDALVADFGVAKALAASAAEGASGMTSAGVALGTPAYMAPEQAAADPNVDHRADLYAVGLIAYEMLAGSHPFTGRSPQALLAAQATESVESIVRRRPSVGAALAAVVMQMLEKRPGDRPQTAEEALRAVDATTTPRATAAVTAEPDSETLPERRRPRKSNLSAVNLLLAIALVAVIATLYGRRQLGWQAVSRVESLPTAIERKSIAVLPFTNIGNDSATEYFSDGVTEELITSLTKVESLRVAGRTSSFALKGKNLDTREIGAKLGVGSVLEGSIRRAGNRLRITAQLVSAQDGYQVWAESYDREVKDVFAMQDEIARSIVSALRVRLTGSLDSSLAKQPTKDLAAYELYLKGRFALNQRTGQSIVEAARLLEQAVARDRRLARAYAALADAYLLMPLYSGTPPGTSWPKAKAAGERALRLDSTLADAETSLAYGTMLYEWNWSAADARFRKAIATTPNYATAHHWYADFLAGQGRLEESLREMQLAQQLDPLSLIIGTEVAWVLALLHRSDEAIAQAQRNLALNQNFPHTHFILGLANIGKRNYPEAIAELERALALGGFYHHGFAALIHAQSLSGNRAEALRLLNELKTRSTKEYVPPFALAIAYTGLGDKNSAFAMLNKGIDEKDVLMPENFFDPMFDSLRSDARYDAILRRMGIKRRA
jgi:eukaryotic-like serine/threonine-protein kinase